VTGVVRLDEVDGVPVVTIDRPEARNAIDAEMSAGLGAVFARLADDHRVRAIVLTGAGDRSFCAGMDLKAPRALAGPGPGIEILLRARYPKPIVAAVNGAAVGGGLDLALSCDLIVAAAHATFALPEVARGVASVGGSTRLAQRLPLAIALELSLTGAPIDAERAAALGLVNRVTPTGGQLAAAVELAGRIAANAPLAVAFTRRRVHDAGRTLDAAAWSAVQAAAAPVFASADAGEGARAFAERRPAVWSGR
jgi:enoyl-CoA hydratase